MQYLTSHIHRMTGQAVLCLAKLGDCLGLCELLNNAVDALTQKPWVDNMHRIAQIVAMSMFQQDVAKIDEFLHHPRRGAYTELQVLELLEMADMPQNSIVAVLKMDRMQPAELDTLLGILVNTKYAPTAGMLLCKAVQQHILPKGPRLSPEGSACTRIVHNIMMPDKGTEEYISLPHSTFRLNIDHTRTQDGEHMFVVVIAC